MAPILSANTPQANPQGKQREQTLRLVVNGLASKPAYLIIFGLGLVSTSIVAMAVMLSDRESVLALSFGSWFIYCIVALGVVYRLAVSENAQSDDIFDQTAREEFMRGVDASFLSGEWKSTWTPDGMADKAENVELTITTKGCMVMICAYSEESGRTFWMWGRLSDGNVLSLLAWGKFRGGHSRLAGVDFMMLDAGADEVSMSGQWMGRGKTGEFVKGTAVWKKVSD